MTTRRKHTDSERAQERLDVVTRQLDRARARQDKAIAESSAAQADVTALEKRAAYLRQDPDLPQQPSARLGGEPTTTGTKSFVAGVPIPD